MYRYYRLYLICNSQSDEGIPLPADVALHVSNKYSTYLRDWEGDVRGSLSRYPITCVSNHPAITAPAITAPAITAPAITAHTNVLKSY